MSLTYGHVGSLCISLGATVDVRPFVGQLACCSISFHQKIKLVITVKRNWTWNITSILSCRNKTSAITFPTALSVGTSTLSCRNKTSAITIPIALSVGTSALSCLYKAFVPMF